MPRLFHRPGQTGAGGICLATPCYSGVSAGYSFALAQTCRALEKQGIAFEPMILSGDCHVDDARNQLVAQFLRTECEALFFLDADVRWEPESVVELFNHDADIVGASYAFKQDAVGFPVRHLPGEIQENEQGLVPVLGLPTGFLCIRRRVLESLADQAPKFLSKLDGSTVPLIFERTRTDEQRIGGDYTFCQKAISAGFRVFLAPDVELDHYGETVWSGSWGHWARCELHGPLKAGLMEIRHGRETAQTMKDLVEAWGNSWSVDASMLSVLVHMARNSTKPILDLGSGLSSIAMAATGAEVHAVEHDEAFMDQLDGVTVHHAPLVDEWYYPWAIPDKDWEFVVCDGPPRHLSDRTRLFEMPCSQARIVMDDTDDPNIGEFVRALDRNVQYFGAKKHFAVIDRGAL